MLLFNNVILVVCKYKSNPVVLPFALYKELKSYVVPVPLDNVFQLLLLYPVGAVAKLKLLDEILSVYQYSHDGLSLSANTSTSYILACCTYVCVIMLIKLLLAFLYVIIIFKLD